MTVQAAFQAEDFLIEIGNPRLKALFHLWDKHRQGSRMPSWDQFDILEMGTWIGYLTLLEVVSDPLDMIYRVFSTRVSDDLQRDLTGKRLSESGHLIPEPVRESYFSVVRSGIPCVHSLNDITGDGREITFERLVLPLSDDGECVNMILVGY